MLNNVEVSPKPLAAKLPISQSVMNLAKIFYSFTVVQFATSNEGEGGLQFHSSDAVD